MPSLDHNASFERHLSLAALAHCPRHYWYVDQVRKGLKAGEPPTTPLTIGLLAHVGLSALWGQRQSGGLWTPSLALDTMDNSPEAAAAVLSILKDGPQSYQSLKVGIVEYASHWTGVRDDWKPLAVAPEDVPPQAWTILDNCFVSYPDLIVETKQEPVRVVDHKTSAWRFEADKWEWHPELLTQCLAAQQLRPGEPVYYQVDYMQRPGSGRMSSQVWSFPVTPVWEFDEQKEQAARQWLTHLIARRGDYLALYQNQPWPQEISQCQTPWGLCGYFKDCFKQVTEDLGG